jgi:hypothetical protein
MEQGRKMFFLQDRNDEGLSAMDENSEADTDLEPTPEILLMKEIFGSSSDPVDDSSVTATPTQAGHSHSIHPSPYRHAKSLAGVSAASQSMRSLCAATNVNMILASPRSVDQTQNGKASILLPFIKFAFWLNSSI